MKQEDRCADNGWRCPGSIGQELGEVEDELRRLLDMEYLLDLVLVGLVWIDPLLNFDLDSITWNSKYTHTKKRKVPWPMNW